MPDAGCWRTSVAALLLALRCQSFLHSSPSACCSRPSAACRSSFHHQGDSRWLARPHSLKRGRAVSMTYADDERSDSEFIPDVLPRHPEAPPPGIRQEDWAATTAAAQAKWRSTTRLTPNPLMSPDYVVSTVLTALRHNDEPYADHGCEVAIRFSSSANPASRLSPSQMRRYLSDPALPFYRILAEWDEMDTRGGGLSLTTAPACTGVGVGSGSGSGSGADGEAADSAYAAVLVRRGGAGPWSTVNIEMVREGGCWLIDRLWVAEAAEQRSEGQQGGSLGKGGPEIFLSIADVLSEAANDAMGCRYGDYDPLQLVSWLEQEPSEELTPKMVVLNCLCALRAKDIPYKNAGCALTIRFCSPNNAASTLTPAHFSTYLEEPWYKIIAEWSEMAFHSEEVNPGATEADLVVLLKREGDEEWTSVNWLLGKHNGMWLTERIWVDDV